MLVTPGRVISRNVTPRGYLWGGTLPPCSEQTLEITKTSPASAGVFLGIDLQQTVLRAALSAGRHVMRGHDYQSASNRRKLTKRDQASVPSGRYRRAMHYWNAMDWITTAATVGIILTLVVSR
jgi:hypothetical protein